MAELTPTGRQGTAMVALRDMLAQSATLQSDIGATGDAAAKIAAAKGYIFLLEYLAPTDGYALPYLTISLPANDRDQRVGTGLFTGTGDLELAIERAIPTAYTATETKETRHNAAVNFMNFYEGVKTDVMNLVDTAGGLLINSFSVIEGPGLIPIADTPGDALANYNYYVRVLVGYGITG